MEEVLNSIQIKQFIEGGFVRIDNVFPEEIAATVRNILWEEMTIDPNDPSTWQKPVIRLGMYSQPPFIQSAKTPILHAAFDQLVGKDKWLPCRSMGTFPVRLLRDELMEEILRPSKRPHLSSAATRMCAPSIMPWK